MKSKTRLGFIQSTNPWMRITKFQKLLTIFINP